MACKIEKRSHVNIVRVKYFPKSGKSWGEQWNEGAWWGWRDDGIGSRKVCNLKGVNRERLTHGASLRKALRKFLREPWAYQMRKYSPRGISVQVREESTLIVQGTANRPMGDKAEGAERGTGEHEDGPWCLCNSSQAPFDHCHKPSSFKVQTIVWSLALGYEQRWYIMKMLAEIYVCVCWGWEERDSPPCCQCLAYKLEAASFQCLLPSSELFSA